MLIKYTNPDLEGQICLVNQPVRWVYVQVPRATDGTVNTERQVLVVVVGVKVGIHGDGLELLHLPGDVQGAVPVTRHVVTHLANVQRETCNR